MKNFLIKNIHWFIILYAINGIYDAYVEKSESLSRNASELPIVKNKIDRAKLKLAKIDQFKKNLSASKERVAEVVKNIEKIQKQFPTEINDTEVQRILTELSGELKIVDAIPSPGTEEAHGFYFAKKYVLTAQGTYLQFLVFFENLAKADRILNVQQVSMSIDSSLENRSRFQVLNFETTIESFRYNPSYKESAEVK